MAFHNSCTFLYTISYNHHLFLLMLLLWWFSVTITLSSSQVSGILTGAREEDSAKHGVLCKAIEREALMTFKSGLRDDDGLLSSWSNDSPDCCNWMGVSCNNHTGHVLKLNLRSPDNSGRLYWMFTLRGEISSSLLTLKHLEYLDLSRNDFNHSKIPAFLGSFEKLRYLNLSSSLFSGLVPPHLGNLSSLEYLDVGFNASLLEPGGRSSAYYTLVVDNPLEVESLEWLRGLPYLKHLNLDYVKLEKAGPDWLKHFNMIPSLLELHLQNCRLSNLPQSINHPINLTSISTLDLSVNYFNSTLPPWLFNLTGLVNLKLSESSLPSAPIPDEIGKLVKLQSLDLFFNNIGGQLPASLGNLSNLVTLDLAFNRIEGRLPVTFGHLCNLQSLSLGFNKFEGEINGLFDGLARCSKKKNQKSPALIELGLLFNSFWGSIPLTIGSLTSLAVLDVYHNQMNGTIGESVGELSELGELDLSNNPWQGLLIETHFEKHTKLQSLRLSTTSKGNLAMDVRQDWIPPFTRIQEVRLDRVKILSKEFPAWVQTQHELQALSLMDCGVSGSIPAEFWKSCTNITELVLSNNAISNNVAEALILLVPGKLSILCLDNNSFSGEIPLNIGQLAPSLFELDLSSNSISGNIPSSICQIKGLLKLFLSNNILTGELTHHLWEEMEQLFVLDLSNNRFFGKIPESLGSLTDLHLLFLNDNNLEGEIPSFTSSTRLQVIDVGGNNLTGIIPTGLTENKLELIILRLRGNMLSGIISPDLCLLSNLKIIDFAQNNFHGTIPWCLGNMNITDDDSTNYIFGDGITLVSKGREDDFKSQIIRLVHLVDLSQNNLSGTIPESLFNLTATHTLNLSMNHLTGEIPSNIGKLRKLESLDLSVNHLSGPIPQSLSELSFLNSLNLSHNNLSGRIPSSTQLQSLSEPSRYDGNPLLCGLPLPTKCPGDSTDTSHDEGEEKVEHRKKRFDLDKWGLILSLFSGFFVGFWGFCGSLAIKASWRQTYFGFLEDMWDKLVVIVSVRLRRKMEAVRGQANPR